MASETKMLCWKQGQTTIYQTDKFPNGWTIHVGYLSVLEGEPLENLQKAIKQHERFQDSQNDIP